MQVNYDQYKNAPPPPIIRETNFAFSFEEKDAQSPDLLPNRILLDRLGEGRPRRVVGVLAPAGEQWVAALTAHIHAGHKVVPVRLGLGPGAVRHGQPNL